MLSSLIIDGQPVSAISPYTFENVTSNHTITAIFVLDNSAPEVPTVSVSSKTTSSFTVSAVATDVDGDNLIYQLYIGETLKDTSASTASGTQVSLTASGLSEYTSYNYEVKVSDGTETTSITSITNTKCGGYSSNPCTNLGSQSCPICGGSGTTGNSSYYYTGSCSTSSWQESYSSTEQIECTTCDRVTTYSYTVYACKYCGDTERYTERCNDCGKTDNSFYEPSQHYCKYCNKTGTVTICTTHNMSSTHCVHGYTSSHN